MLFHSKTYGESIKAAVELYVNADLKTLIAQDLTNFFNNKINSIPPHIDLEKRDVRDGYFSHILKDLSKLK